MSNIDQTQKDNLYKALGIFLEGFRPYAVELLKNEFGEDWATGFANTLPSAQSNNLLLNIKNGSSSEAAIDYLHFKSFAISNKEILRTDFGKRVEKLPTWFVEIAEVRNKIAHFDEVDEDDATKAWIHLKTIAKVIKTPELEAELIRLQENKTAAAAKKEENQASPVAVGSTAPWFRVVTPHLDIREGRLDESVFAANLAEVALGGGREIYANPVLFFSKTFFTAGLKSIARTVVKGLNGKEDAENRVISLQTGFGGGKTHSLISLYHICKWGRQAAESETVKDLIEYTGVPDFDAANIAVFTNTTNDPIQGRKVNDDLTIRTLWGELAYQLGGNAAYELIKDNDQQMVSPAGLFKGVLAQCVPALILIDELADYCIKASAVTVGNSNLADQTISFMQELTEAIAESNNCVAIITLPASPQEVGNTAQAHQVLSSLESRVRRVGADTKPVADEEIYEVIRRRLFEDIGDATQIEATASRMVHLYQENWMELPDHAKSSEYKKRIEKSYPFHPELIDVFRIRWASSHDFQRTRGVLRLLAAIVSDLWKRKNSLPGGNLLIDAGDVSFANIDALSGQLKRLYGSGYDAVITADVSGSASNAFKIDQIKPQFGRWNLAESIASVVLLNSFGTDGANRGVSIADLKLNLLEPEEFNHNSINGALDELEATSFHLYFAQAGGAGKRYWYHTKPNINILINQVKSDIKSEESQAEILRRLNEKAKNITAFNPLVNPTGDIPEQQRLTLIILGPQYKADPNEVSEITRTFVQNIATKKGNSERIYRNTMLFLAVSDIGQTNLFSVAVRDYLACKKVSEEYRSQLESDQREELKKKLDEASRQVETSLVNAYSTILKYSSSKGVEPLVVNQFKESLDTQINTNVYATLKDAEWLLESVGLGTLRNNNLLPTMKRNIKAKDIYEAFIRFDDKPMIRNSDAVRNSLQRYCSEGAFCIAFGDGVTFTNYYLKENVPSLDVSESSYWLIDPTLKPGPKDEVPVTIVAPPETPNTNTSDGIESTAVDPNATEVRTLKSISIGGKVPLERYSELFNYFITPFAMNGNKIEIEVRFKIKSTESSPLTDSKPQYKSAKEAAKQLGLEFDQE